MLEPSSQLLANTSIPWARQKAPSKGGTMGAEGLEPRQPPKTESQSIPTRLLEKALRLNSVNMPS